MRTTERPGPARVRCGPAWIETGWHTPCSTPISHGDAAFAAVYELYRRKFKKGEHHVGTRNNHASGGRRLGISGLAVWRRLRSGSARLHRAEIARSLNTATI